MGRVLLVLLMIGVVAYAADERGLSLAAPSGGGSSPTGSGGIPAEYERHYRQAASTCGPLDWTLLAAVGKVETDHGRSGLAGVTSGTNHAGAAGPMQFLAPTFAEVRSKHPDVGSNVYDPSDAIPAAAHYLCDGGLVRGDKRGALMTYNPSSAYVDKVLSQQAGYREGA